MRIQQIDWFQDEPRLELNSNLRLHSTISDRRTEGTSIHGRFLESIES